MFSRTVLQARVTTQVNLFQGLRMIKSLPKTMKAVGFYKHLDITDPNSLKDFSDVALPTIRQSDVLVEVKATAVNPIDTKIRSPGPMKPHTLPEMRILGFDGAGVVADKGSNVTSLNVGDEVIFTGDIQKNGSNAEYVAIDEVMVAVKPKNLTFEEAAAMPLTSVTAYEALYDRLGLTEDDKGKTLLIINSAGGVGAVATQLAKHLGLFVIGTASRPETREFTQKYGADLVLDHSKDLASQLESAGHKEIDYILVNYDPFPYWNVLMHIVKPQGKICLIVDCSQPVDLRALKDKSITLVYEMMNTRIKYSTPDKARHKEILKEVSKMLESGKLKTSLTKIVSPLNSKNLRDAHQIIEDQRMIGKLVMKGF